MTGMRHDQHGFTLIEMMAVVTIFALLAALVAPQVGALTGRGLRTRAEDLGAQLQLARERSILTGTPHRVLFDLEGDGYRLELWVTDAEALGEDEAAAEEIVIIPGQTPLDLAAPREAERSWHPLPGMLGSFAWVQGGITIAAVETGGDWIERGDVGLAFEWDGTTAPAAVYLDDENDRRLRVEVLPLADGVRIEHVE